MAPSESCLRPSPSGSLTTGAGWWRGARDLRDRDPFPLPLLANSAPPQALPSSATSRRRLRSRLALNSSVNAVITALNCLAAGGACRRASVLRTPASLVADIGLARPAQQDVLLRIRRCVLASADGEPNVAASEALRELLKSPAAGYGAPRGSLAVYSCGAPSLPWGLVLAL